MIFSGCDPCLALRSKEESFFLLIDYDDTYILKFANFLWTTMTTTTTDGHTDYFTTCAYAQSIAKCTESVATSQGLIVLTLPWNPHTWIRKITPYCYSR